MRAFFLSLIVLSEILIAATNNTVINEGALSLLATMIFVVLVSFSFSAILQSFKSIKLSRNYTISGILGIVLGIFFYMWVDANIKASVDWLEAYGLYFLLLLIFVSAVYLYFSSHSSGRKEPSFNDTSLPVDKSEGTE